MKKTEIFRSVVIAMVVAIQDVAKYGFYCNNYFNVGSMNYANAAQNLWKTASCQISTLD